MKHKFWCILTLGVIVCTPGIGLANSISSTSPSPKSSTVVEASSCNKGVIPQVWSGTEAAPNNNWPRPLMGSHQPSPEQKASTAQCHHVLKKPPLPSKNP